MLKILFCSLLVLSPILAASAKPNPWGVIVVGRQAESEKLATADLQRYLAQVTGVIPAVTDAKAWSANPRPAVILGSPKSNPLLAGIDVKKLGDQGFYLANSSVKGANVVIAAGSCPEGATNAIYGLLRELGYGFYLGSEAVPQSLPNRLPKSPVVKAPVFKVRGVLPWYNFFNSPTTWDPVDHRTFADQLIRMGANFVGFHTYDSEPFAAYEENGKMVWGGRLLNTKNRTWGTSPLPANEFGFGTGKLYADDYFGAASTFIANNDEAIKAEQDIMRESLDYAKKRGLHTCLGFEIHGDPLKPADRDVFLKRINRVLDLYPSLDYLWIWEPETQGVQGFASQYNQHILGSKLEPDSLLPLYGMARRDVFDRVVNRAVGERPFYQDNENGKAARANEGARLEQYGQLAYHAIAHRKHAPKLIISGWGGDQRLLSEEYYEGLDKLLPKDVVFSSLDNIGPRPRVDKVYNELPSDRQRWPIPWLENDGDQWHPQPYVHIYEGLVKDAHAGGSQGILSIHWRTRDVEENFGYLMSYAWNPGMSAKEFFRDYARRCYAPEIAVEMGIIHTQLDSLGYRWVGGAGQVECGTFNWGPGEEGKANKLRVLRDKASTLLPKAGSSSARLKWLITEMDWSLQYRDAELAAVEAKNLLAQAEKESPDQAKQTAEKALMILDRGNLAQAMYTFARRITTRGEYGVLATINTKAFAAWRDLRNECAKLAGKNDFGAEYCLYSEIILPRLIGSIAVGQNLELSPIVLDGQAAWIHYRTLGSDKWRTQPLEENKNWVKRTVIPASDLNQPGVEFGFSFSEDPSKPMAYQPVTVTVMPAVKVDKTPSPTVKIGKEKTLRLTVKEGKAVPIELEWNALLDADYYKVYRDGKVVAETAVAMLPDCPSQAAGEYVVEAWRDGKVIAKSEPARYVTPIRTVDEKFDVQARAGFSGVWLKWPAGKSPNLTSYKISRTPSGGGESQVLKTLPAQKDADNAYYDAPPAGEWIYAIAPISMTGQEGTPAKVTIYFSPRKGIAPIFSLPLNVKPEGAKVVGDVTFDESGAAFHNGYIVLPHQDLMNLGQAMTLEFEFKADETGNMPVLLCHGVWQVDGWFVQLLGGRLMLRAARGDALGQNIEPGKWYNIRVVYDGAQFGLQVNGQWIEQNADPVIDVPAKRGLVIGQYDNPDPSYAFHGTIRNLKLYNEPLM